VLSFVLRQPVAWFYRPGMESLEEIVMPSGHTIKDRITRTIRGSEQDAEKR
jgi:hypothetical protein